MKGILLVSHGSLAQSFFDTLESFFADKMEQIDYLCLGISDDPDSFKEEMQKKLNKLDSGDGVWVFADLYGGTPSNLAAACLLMHKDDSRLSVITGMNLSMLMRALETREEPLGCEQVMQAGKDAIQSVNIILKNRMQQEEGKAWQLNNTG